MDTTSVSSAPAEGPAIGVPAGKRGRPRKDPSSAPAPKKSKQEVISGRIADLKRQQESLLKERERARTTEQLNLIVYVYLQLQREAEEVWQRHPDRPKPASNAQQRVAQLLGVSTKTVSSTMKTWHENQKIRERNAPANRNKKKTRIPRTVAVRVKIRTFVREERMHHRMVVARDVLSFLVKEQILPASSTQSETKASLRAVQRYLQQNGFSRGNAKGSQSVTESKKLRDARTRYLQALTDNELSDTRRRLVDLDESYIHHHHQKKIGIFDPTDLQYIQPRKKHKGQRYCFIAAIRERNPNAAADSTVESDQAGLVPNSFWFFCPNKSAQKGDYHKAFNGQNFVKWFREQLLPNLSEPSLIRLDNAKYHCTMPASTPKVTNVLKADLVKSCEEKKIPMGKKDTVATLTLKLREWIAANVKKEIIEAAEEKGHLVLFTPPYHSDLQPIELVWAQVKGAIAMQYSDGTTFKDVGTRLEEQFAKLANEGHRVEKLYRHVAHIEDAYRIADDPLAPEVLGDSDSDFVYSTRQALAKEIEKIIPMHDEESESDEFDSDDLDDEEVSEMDEDDVNE